MEVAGWRVWYIGKNVCEGRTFEQWERLLADGVLFVKLYYDEKTSAGIPLALNLSGDDWYWQTPDGVFGSSNDPHAEIKKRYPGASIKRGKWGTVEEMDAANIAAIAAREGPA
jgi:hypothetical protein